MENTKSAYGQVYKSNFIEIFLFFPNQRLVFELFPLRIISQSCLETNCEFKDVETLVRND